MQREYQIDLVTALPRLTWRRFLVLIRGFSPNSASVVAHRASATFGPRGEEVRAVEGPVAAQQAFDSIFKPPPGRA